MVTILNIRCPRCGEVAQLFLSTRVSVVILNCPSCLSPVMYLRRKTFLLDKRKLKKYRWNSRAHLVSRLLEQIADADSAARCAVKRGAAPAGRFRAGSPLPAAPDKLAADRHEERYITEDDCINLRIELALCADSREFISHL
ncbi:MAG: hypothetical protein JW699_02625 [Chitinispirillaceae bacterium]|nr:hypothetical protein [Chitinispirillaceae bacterium]